MCGYISRMSSESNDGEGDGNSCPSPSLRFDDEFVDYDVDEDGETDTEDRDTEDHWAVLDPDKPSNDVALPLRTADGEDSQPHLLFPPGHDDYDSATYARENTSESDANSPFGAERVHDVSLHMSNMLIFGKEFEYVREAHRQSRRE